MQASPLSTRAKRARSPRGGRRGAAAKPAASGRGVRAQPSQYGGTHSMLGRFGNLGDYPKRSLQKCLASLAIRHATEQPRRSCCCIATARRQFSYPPTVPNWRLVIWLTFVWGRDVSCTRVTAFASLAGVRPGRCRGRARVCGNGMGGNRCQTPLLGPPLDQWGSPFEDTLSRCDGESELGPGFGPTIPARARARLPSAICVSRTPVWIVCVAIVHGTQPLQPSYPTRCYRRPRRE